MPDVSGMTFFSFVIPVQTGISAVARTVKRRLLAVLGVAWENLRDARCLGHDVFFLTSFPYKRESWQWQEQ